MRHALILGCLLLMIGCAAQQPQVVRQPVEKKSSPPPAEAITHYLRAKRAEVAGRRDLAVEQLLAAVAYDTTSATLYSALAYNLNALGKFADAIPTAQRAVQLDPKDPQNRWHLYQALMKGRQDTTAALVQLESIVRTEEYPLSALDQMMQIYGNRQQPAQVIKVLDRIVALPGLGSRERMIAAENYIRYEATDRAKIIFTNITQTEPDNNDAWLNLGLIQFNDKDTLAAETTFRKALKQTDPLQVTRENARIWGQLVRIYRQESQLQNLLSENPMDAELVTNLSQVFIDMAREANVKVDERGLFYGIAEKMLDAILQQDANQEMALANKAQLLLETGRPQEARAFFSEANKKMEKAEYYLGIAHTFMAEGDLPSAQKLLEQLIGLAPTDSRFYPQIVSDLARVYMGTGNVDKARQIYRQAAEANPNQPTYRHDLARTYLADKSWQEAINLLEPLTTQVEDNLDFLQEVLFDLGSSYERAGQFDKAIATFQRQLTLRPDDPRANNYLGYMLAERGIRLSEAKVYIEQALKADADNGAYLDSLGWVYYQLGNYQEALRHLSKALTIEEDALRQMGNNPRAVDAQKENLMVIHEHAGDAAKAVGDLERARKHYERALEFAPDNKGLQNKLKALAEGSSTSKAP